jgi:hypothetical protein
MVSRNRDIATMLGRSEAVNTSNIAFSTGGGGGGGADSAAILALIDSDYIQARQSGGGVSISGSGTTTRVVKGIRIQPGDPVIANAQGFAEHVRQQEFPHTRDQYVTSIYGSGNGVPVDSGLPPQVHYIGNNKIVVVWQDLINYGSYNHGSLRARCGILNTDGTQVTAWGATVTLQSGNYVSGTNFSGCFRYNGNSVFDAATGRIHCGYIYYYYASYVRQIIRCRTIYPEDIEDVNNLNLILGNVTTIFSATDTNNNLVAYYPVLLWDEEIPSNGGAIAWYGNEGLQATQIHTLETNGNGLTVGARVALGGHYITYASQKANWWDNRTKKWCIVNTSSYIGSDVNVIEFTRRNSQAAIAGSTVIINGAAAGGGDAHSLSTTNYGGFFGACYDSSSERGIVAWVEVTAGGVGKLASYQPSLSPFADPTIGPTVEYAPEVDGYPWLFHDKDQRKNAIIWPEQTSTTNKTLFRWFTCDSVGVITLEDSTYELYSDYALQTNGIKLNDFKQVVMINDATSALGGQYNRSGDNGSGKVILFRPEERGVANLLDNGSNYLGISQDSADSGDTITIKLNGEIDTNQFGLSPGTSYYINRIDGDLETNTNNGSVRAGIAVTNGSIQITTT